MKQHLLGIWITEACECQAIVSRGQSLEISPVTLDENPTPGKASASSAERPSSLSDYPGSRNQGIGLVIPSSWCMAIAIPVADIPRRAKRYETMVYRLEEQLPVPAEEFVADFVSSADISLGVAARSERLAPYIEAVEKQGFTVQFICPAAMLAWQTLKDKQSSRHQDFDPRNCVVSFSLEDRSEVFVTRHGQLTHWWNELQPPAHLRHKLLAQTTLQGPLKNALFTEDCGISQDDFDACGIQDVTTLEHVDIQQIIARNVQDVTAGRSMPIVNLCKGTLSAADPLQHLRRPMQALAAAAVLFFVCLIAAMGWRTYQYDQLANTLSTQQEAVFRQAFPGQRVPFAVRSRLESEAKLLQGLQGDTQALDLRRNALTTLYNILARLPMPSSQNIDAANVLDIPDALRYRIVDMRIDPERIYIEGQARTHGNADLLAAALRRQSVFLVEPPRSEKLSTQGVSFTLNATPPGSPAPGNPGNPGNPAPGSAPENPSRSPLENASGGGKP